MLLRLFEAFLEAAPQLVLQIYILCVLGTTEGAALGELSFPYTVIYKLIYVFKLICILSTHLYVTVVLQVAGLLSSWLAITSTLVTYHKSLRLSQPKKSKLRLPGLATMFFWRLFTVASRVMALALFASVFQMAIFGVVGGHWILMLIWMIMLETDYCKLIDGSGKEHSAPLLEFLFRIVGAFIHIFCFFNLIEGHTRLRCATYYAIVYLENAAMVLTWYFVASKETTTTWYFIPALLIVLLGFWFGIMFQILYYKWYHPNNISVLHVRKRIRWCIPCSDLYMCKEETEDPDKAAAYERVLNHKSEVPLQTSTPAPSTYSYPSPHKQNTPIQTSTPAPSVYSYNSPERPVQMVQPQPPRNHHPPSRQGSRATSQSMNNNRVNRAPVVKRMPVQHKPTPSPIHGPYHTPYASKPMKPKPFSPPQYEPPSPIKTLVSAPPRMEAEESTEEPLPQSARASMAHEVPINYGVPAEKSRLSSGQTTTSDDVTMSSSEDLISQPTAKVVNPRLAQGKKPGVVPIKRATFPQAKQSPTRAPPKPLKVSIGKLPASSQDESSSSGSYSESETDTDEGEFSPGQPIVRSHSVTFGPPPEGPNSRTDEVISNPTKKKHRPPTPRDMSGGRPRSPRDMSGGRPRSPRDMSSGRPRSPRDMSSGRPRSPRDMSSGRPRSPRDMSSGRPRSPRDMSSGRPRSPRDMSSGRPRSPRDMSSGRPRSSRDMSSGRPRSPRDMSSGRPRSPRDMSQGRPRSPRDLSEGRPRSPKDMSQGRPRSPRDMSQGRPKSPQEMTSRPRSPREISGAPYPRIPMHDPQSVFRPVPQRATAAPQQAPPPSLAYPAPQPMVPPTPAQHKQPRQRTPRHRNQPEATSSSRGHAQPSSGTRALPTRQAVQKGPPRKRPTPSKNIPPTTAHVHVPQAMAQVQRSHSGRGHHPQHLPQQGYGGRAPPQSHPPVRGDMGKPGNETTV